MATVQRHYDSHLGPIYSWMLGDMVAGMERARQDLRAWGLGKMREDGQGFAVDLGAGSGLYAIPLAEMGYTVLAIDSCRHLVDELVERAGPLPVRPMLGELSDFRRHCQSTAEAIVCMNDTLTHLPSRQSVEQLFEDAAATLGADGIFVATFRDYVTAPLKDDARFIPVRSDDCAILTCFLEYHDDTVLVHDLLHTRGASGWEFTVSSYPKLRLDPKWVQAVAERVGLAATLSVGPRGMVCLVARRQG